MTRRPRSHHGRVALGLVAASLAVSSAGCSAFKAHRHSKPPFETFVPGGYRAPKNTTMPPVLPPDAAKAPWLVAVVQREPRPMKNPHWVTVPMEAAAELEMPAHSHFRCIYNPVNFEGIPGEHIKLVAEWKVSREVRCSSDGWRTSFASMLLQVFGPDGTLLHRSGEAAALELDESIDGRPTTTSVLLRAGSGDARLN